MVTASHNPPQDNGYKVYLGAGGRGDAGQIVPPADAEIAARDRRRRADARRADGPRDGWTHAGRRRSSRTTSTRVSRGRRRRAARASSTSCSPRCTASAARTVVEALRPGRVRRRRTSCPQQAEPDPAFPTVAFPNPEEPGAIDLALAAARERGADLVIANDPDADRCAVAVPDPARRGGWRMLRGDEVGALLGEHLLRAGRAGCDGAVVASSIVSSQLLGRIAAAHGVRHETTLTGFKWIARVPGLVYGYEEALGYCVAPERWCATRTASPRRCVVAELAAAAEGRGPDAARRARRPRPRRTACTPPTSCRCGSADLVADRARRWRRCARGRPPTLGGLAVGRGGGPGRGLRRPAADRRPALPDGGGRPGRRPAERDGAEAEVLPGGGRARRRRRPRGGPRRGGGPARRAGGATCGNGWRSSVSGRCRRGERHGRPRPRRRRRGCGR